MKKSLTILKVKLKSIFGYKFKNSSNQIEQENEFNYDEHVDFYYANLINSIVLFSLGKKDLEKLASRLFEPLFELESEIDYAYTPLLFETIFRNNIIDESLKPELLAFKKTIDDIPPEIWDWDFLDEDEKWINARQKAEQLLSKLGVKNKSYNEDYLTVYDKAGNILKKGKKVP